MSSRSQCCAPALRGWTGIVDELAMDAIARRDLELEVLEQLSINALGAPLRSIAGQHANIAEVLAELVDSLGA